MHLTGFETAPRVTQGHVVRVGPSLRSAVLESYLYSGVRVVRRIVYPLPRIEQSRHLIGVLGAGDIELIPTAQTPTEVGTAIGRGEPQRVPLVGAFNARSVA